MSKQCFKCKSTKPIYEFYIHKMMNDGHLNKCKACTKSDVLKRLAVVKLNPEWISKERERCRKKQARYRILGIAAPTKPETMQRWLSRNVHKTKAKIMANNALRDGKIKRKTSCERCGASPKRLEKHHDDYSQPLKVQWLCLPCHGLTRRK